MSDITSGAFAIGGTIVGGVLSFLTTQISTHTQVRAAASAAARAHEEQVITVQYTACTAFVVATERFVDASRGVLAELWSKNSTTRTVYAKYLSQWDSLVAAFAPVQLAGPPDVATVARALYKQVADLANHLDEWNGSGQPPQNFDSGEAIGQSRDAIVTFTQMAQVYFFGQRAVPTAGAGRHLSIPAGTVRLEPQTTVALDTQPDH